MERHLWTLLSPLSTRMTPQRAAPEARSNAQRTIGFLSNRKPNTDELQFMLAKMLEEQGYATRTYAKVNASIPASDALLERISEECMLVVTGTGD